MSFRFSATVVLTLASLALPLGAAVVYSEGVTGDLSSNRNAPTPIIVVPGDNDILYSSGIGDTEYFTITIPPLHQLTGVVVKSYSGGDPTSFIALQRGSTFTVDSASAQPEDLDGYAHFGPGSGNVLDDMGAGFGARGGGFTPPLGPGSYTFWSQQIGFSPSSYNLSLQVVAIPEPASLGAALVGLACFWRRRKSR
jgi:hypothetical protein